MMRAQSAWSALTKSLTATALIFFYYFIRVQIIKTFLLDAEVCVVSCLLGQKFFDCLFFLSLCVL